MGILNKYKNNSHTIYYVLLVLLTSSLSLSKFMIGICQVLLLLNWFCEGGFKQKIQIFKQRKGLQAFILIYLLLLVWFAFTNDFKLGLHELNFKLPFLELTLIIGTSPALSRKQIDKLLGFFVTSVLVASVISALSIFNIFQHHLNDYEDARDSSLFIHHIRFGILVAIAIIIQLYWIIIGILNNNWKKLILLLPIAWLIFTLVFLRALTGISIIIGSSTILLAIYLFKMKSTVVRLLVLICIVAIPALSFLYIRNAYTRYYSINKVDFLKLANYTPSGNTYLHDTVSKTLENGHYTSIYICNKELRKEWTLRSNVSIDSLDKKKQQLYNTLLRYMTSKGLRKDSAGIAALTKQDVKNIENGLANYIFANNSSLYPRIYEVIWEIDVFNKTKDANGHSLTQRYMYYKISIDLIQEYFWLGVGTGDTRTTYDKYYLTHESGLQPRFQHESHNQFMRFLLEFGIVGFAILMFAFIYPAFSEKKWNDFYFLTIFIITALSFLNEDAIESQVGTMMTALFFTLFLFGSNSTEENK